MVSLIRLRRYAYEKEMFFFLLPLSLCFAIFVAALPTRAFAATNSGTDIVLAQQIMLRINLPVLLDVVLQLYGLLRKRAQHSGWIDASSVFLRIMNIVALTLYCISAADLVSCESNSKSLSCTDRIRSC